MRTLILNISEFFLEWKLLSAELVFMESASHLRNWCQDAGNRTWESLNLQNFLGRCPQTPLEARASSAEKYLPKIKEPRSTESTLRACILFLLSHSPSLSLKINNHHPLPKSLKQVIIVQQKTLKSQIDRTCFHKIGREIETRTLPTSLSLSGNDRDKHSNNMEDDTDEVNRGYYYFTKWKHTGQVKRTVRKERSGKHCFAVISCLRRIFHRSAGSKPWILRTSLGVCETWSR